MDSAQQIFAGLDALTLVLPPAEVVPISFLAALPADVMRVVISLLVLLACALIWRGVAPRVQRGAPAILATAGLVRAVLG